MAPSQVVQALSMTAIILAIPPTIFHIINRNVPILCLLCILILLNINAFVSATVWPNDEGFLRSWDGKIYCDIVTKILIGSYVAVMCSTTAMARNLSLVMSNDGKILDLKSRRKVLSDLALCFVFPIAMMAWSYIVQATRYYIQEVNGCNASYIQSWVTILLIQLWPMVWSLIATYYAILTIWRYLKRRRDFKDILHCTGSGLTAVSFTRLLIFCIIVIMVVFPFSIYFFVYNIVQTEFMSFSWSQIHKSEYWNIIQRVPFTAVNLQTWLYISLTYVAFLFFGTGSDARKMYFKLLDWIGLGKYVRKLYPQSLMNWIFAMWTRYILKTKDESYGANEYIRRITTSASSSPSKIGFGSDSPATLDKFTNFALISEYAFDHEKDRASYDEEALWNPSTSRSDVRGFDEHRVNEQKSCVGCKNDKKSGSATCEDGSSTAGSSTPGPRDNESNSTPLSATEPCEGPTGNVLNARLAKTVSVSNY